MKACHSQTLLFGSIPRRVFLILWQISLDVTRCIQGHLTNIISSTNFELVEIMKPITY